MDNLYLPLRSLTRYRYHLVRVKSYCLSLVYLKAPNYSDRQPRPFSKVFSATSRAVLREFATLDEIAEMPFDELVEWLDFKGKRRFTNPEDNARKLQRVANDAYRLPEEWVAIIHDIISLNLRHMALLENLIQRVETAIAEQMESIPKPLTPSQGLARSSPPASSPRLGIWLVSTSMKPKSPVMPVSNGLVLSSLISKPKIPNSLVPVIASYVTTSVKPLRWSVCTPLSIGATTTANSGKFASIRISAPLCSPLVSWFGWLSGC
jgi:hypothetical protein